MVFLKPELCIKHKNFRQIFYLNQCACLRYFHNFSGGFCFEDLIKLLKLGNIWFKGKKAFSATEAVREMGAELVKHYKRVSKVGTNAGRSGGHGQPFIKAGNDLIRKSNEKGLTKEFAEALKKEGQRLLNKGKSINH